MLFTSPSMATKITCSLQNMYSDSGFESDFSFSSDITTSSGDYDSDTRPAPAAAPHAPWICDPAFGVVHQERCSTCRSDMSHFMEGSTASHDSSFHKAIRERDGRGTVRYLEGLEEGRRMQAKKDLQKLNRYRDEREEARTKRRRAEEEARRLRAELAEMRDALVAIQITYEEQVAALAFEPACAEDDLEALRMMELQSALFAESQSIPEDSHYKEEFLAIAGSSGLEEAEDETCDSNSSGELVDVGTSEKFSVESQRQGSTGPEEEKILSVVEAKAIMDGLSQNPTDPAALARIRNLFVEAHSTFGDKRTDTHLFIIQEAWKILTVLGSRGTVPPLTAVPEMFVDASAQGIGFLWDEKWAAWKLNKGWRSSGRDMPWAEMVAVELGLRTLITAGVSSTHVRVRSDNQAVVTALSVQGIRSPQDALILQEILSLCRTYGIILIPVWVWTKLNPADALSRGRYPGRDLHMDVSAEIPPHLQSFVRDIEASA